MRLPFTKMQSLGNDFVVFDFTQNALSLSSEQAQFISDRHYGIGCDQILIVEATTRGGVDFKYRIFNADGSEVGQCGNGARCFARFVHDQNLTESNPLRVETVSGEMQLRLLENGDVAVEMNAPQFAPEKIPFIADQQQSLYEIEVLGQLVQLAAVSVGNPHAVIQVDDTNNTPVAEFGSALESHPRFPERVNVGFMQVNNDADINLRVFERGAGETLACGSGACAAVVCGQQLGLLGSKVRVNLTGGSLVIEWSGEVDGVVTMTGPAQTVYTGHIEISI